MLDSKAISGEILDVGEINNLVEWLSISFSKNADKVALIDDKYEITYRKLDILSTKVARRLLQISKGSKLGAVGICE